MYATAVRRGKLNKRASSDSCQGKVSFGLLQSFKPTSLVPCRLFAGFGPWMEVTPGTFNKVHKKVSQRT